MAYEKQIWQTGDVITQEKLNHMEDGIAGVGGDIMLVRAIARDADSTENYVVEGLSAQFSDLLAALKDGKLVVAIVGLAQGTYPPMANCIMVATTDVDYSEAMGFVGFEGYGRGERSGGFFMKGYNLYVRENSVSFTCVDMG